MELQPGCLIPCQNVISVTLLIHQYDVLVVTVMIFKPDFYPAYFMTKRFDSQVFTFILLQCPHFMPGCHNDICLKNISHQKFKMYLLITELFTQTEEIRFVSIMYHICDEFYTK